jgi:hypothetical protein
VAAEDESRIKPEVSVNIRLGFPNLGSDAISETIRPVVDAALATGATETFISVYPYDPDEEIPE